MLSWVSGSFQNKNWCLDGEDIKVGAMGNWFPIFELFVWKGFIFCQCVLITEWPLLSKVLGFEMHIKLIDLAHVSRSIYACFGSWWGRWDVYACDGPGSGMGPVKVVDDVVRSRQITFSKDSQQGREAVCVCVLCMPNMNFTIVKMNSKLFLKVAKPILSKIVIKTIIAIQYQW